MAHTGLLDHDEVGIYCGPVRITNRADGQYFSCDPLSDDNIVEEGTDAAAVIIKTGSSVWTATLTVLASATRENTYLWGLRQAHRNTPGGLPFPFALRHRATVLVSAAAVIQRAPTIAYSRTGQDARAYALILTNFDGTVSGFELDTAKPIPEEITALAQP